MSLWKTLCNSFLLSELKDRRYWAEHGAAMPVHSGYGDCFFLTLDPEEAEKRKRALDLQIAALEHPAPNS